MKKVELTSEWLQNWSPTRRAEVSDRACKGLVVRGGPSSKVFFRWVDARNDATGEVRRKRLRLGAWPGLSLGDARQLVHEGRDARKTEASGAATVADLAEAYRRDILQARDEKSAAWSWGIIRTHVLSARPDPRRPPFGQWVARTVRPADVSNVVRAARVERTETVAAKTGATVRRQIGGKAAARAAFTEIKAIFAAAVGTGALEMTPAGALQARALGLKKSPRGRHLDADELSALFEALDLNALIDGTAKPRKLSPTVRLGIALLFYVPVRSHSLLQAEWSEFDLDGGRWTVPVAKLKLHRDARAEARPLVVPLPVTAVAILSKLRSLAGESRWVLASPRNGNKHLGEKVMLRAVARMQQTERLALGSTITIHDARRTWRTWAGDLEVPFDVAEVSLGHALPGVADVYAKASMVAARAKAADLVATAFDRIRLGKSAPVVPLASARKRDRGAK